MESKIWELYTLAQKIIDKKCVDKCYHYGFDTIEDCKDYVARRMLHNKANALKKYNPTKASPKTYLYTFVSDKIIDFFKSAPQKNRVLIDDDSIRNRPSDEMGNTDYSKVMDEIFALLSGREKLYIRKFYLEEYSAKEIAAEIRVHSAKEISKILENARKKLKNKLGYTLEDII